ncbi:MAG: hypothetical protein QM487_05670 [Candidatus Marithrix sp.]
MPRDLDYESNNLTVDPYNDNDGTSFKCKNFDVCGGVLPSWWYNCKGLYICTNCDCMFGTWSSGDKKYTGKGELIFSDLSECPICLKISKSVSQPRCDHTVCLSCFKRCYYGQEIKQPPFPYSEDIQLRYEDPHTEFDINEYPLIKEWDSELDRLDDLSAIQFKNEEYLRKCPICRS